ncbi:hypothetical protein ACPB8Q_03365 [Methanocaldococcus indicus]|uniref:hypothetical protein n=1 Tax=Methanocaldococcus indicus TaxID=213231 RepID=UPI003C6CE8C4
MKLLYYILNKTNKKLGVALKNKKILYHMKNNNDEVYIWMNLESSALLKILLEESVKTAEKVNKEYRVLGIKRHKIIDIGTVFGYDGRISIGVLPADEERVASILVGFHKDDNKIHTSITTTPKKIALLCIILNNLITKGIFEE